MAEVEKVPDRPSTSPEEAIEALERMIIFTLTNVARATPNPVEYVETGRTQHVETMAKDAPRGSRRQRVADHMDWLWVAIGVGVRRLQAGDESPRTKG